MLVYRPNDISPSRANQSQAKFKSAVGGNLLQSSVNLTKVKIYRISHLLLDNFPTFLLVRWLTTSSLKVNIAYIISSVEHRLTIGFLNTTFVQGSLHVNLFASIGRTGTSKDKVKVSDICLNNSFLT